MCCVSSQPGSTLVAVQPSAASPCLRSGSGLITMTNRSQEEPRTCHQIAADSDGIRFTSCKESLYISLNYHRSSSGTVHAKSIWALSRADECHCFCEAEIREWYDEKGDCWSISKDAKVEFGTRGEVVAFFDSPTNKTDPWHGYPIGGRRGLPVHRRPPDKLIEEWHRSGWISYVVYSRLIGGRL